MFVNIPKLGGANLYAYEYDQLNRLLGMDAFNGFDNATNSWTNANQLPVHRDDYKEKASYYPNGNILTYLRNGATGVHGLSMDNFTYQYAKNSSGQITANKFQNYTAS